MILKVCIGNAVIGWIWTKGYIVGYVPKWLPAKREEIRTIVLILIEKSPCFWRKGAKLGEDFVFFNNPGDDHFSVNRACPTRNKEGSLDIWLEFHLALSCLRTS